MQVYKELSRKIVNYLKVTAVLVSNEFLINYYKICIVTTTCGKTSDLINLKSIYRSNSLPEIFTSIHYIIIGKIFVLNESITTRGETETFLFCNISDSFDF